MSEAWKAQRLSEAWSAHQTAKGELLFALQEMFPVKSRVVYRLRAGARTQRGVVTGWNVKRPGFLLVKLAPGRWHRPGMEPHVTSIPFTKIVEKLS